MRHRYVDALAVINYEIHWTIPLDFPGGSDGKASAYNAGDPGSVPGLGRTLGEGNGNPLQYSCLENPMDRGSWQATVSGVTKSWTRLSSLTDFTFTGQLLPDTPFFRGRMWSQIAPSCASRRWLPTQSLSWFVSLSSSMFFSLKYLLWLFLKITVSNARQGSQATFSYSPLLKTVGGSEVYISRRPSSLSPGFPYFVNQISQKNSGSSIFFFPQCMSWVPNQS